VSSPAQKAWLKRRAKKAANTRRKNILREKLSFTGKKNVALRRRIERAVKDRLVEWRGSPRDDGRCAVCGENMWETFQTHHLNGDDHDNNLDNLVTLCGSCHTVTFKARSEKIAVRLFEKRHKRRTRAERAWKTRRKTRIGASS
jgi:hypothetical protein